MFNAVFKDFDRIHYPYRRIVILEIIMTVLPMICFSIFHGLGVAVMAAPPCVVGPACSLSSRTGLSNYCPADHANQNSLSIFTRSSLPFLTAKSQIAASAQSLAPAYLMTFTACRRHGVPLGCVSVTGTLRLARVRVKPYQCLKPCLSALLTLPAYEVPQDAEQADRARTGRTRERVPR
jgi:hypothetical protein